MARVPPPGVSRDQGIEGVFDCQKYADGSPQLSQFSAPGRPHMIAAEALRLVHEARRVRQARSA